MNEDIKTLKTENDENNKHGDTMADPSHHQKLKQNNQ